MSRYKAGDHVRITTDNFVLKSGRFGVLEDNKTHKSPFPFVVRFPNEGSLPVHESEIELAPEPDTSWTLTSKLKDPLADMPSVISYTTPEVTIPIPPVDHTHKIGDVWVFTTDTNLGYRTTTYVYVGVGRFYNVNAGHETTTSHLAPFDHEGWTKVR